MPPQVTEAIALSVQKYSETSKIAVLYTRRWGRLSVIAKGANRPKSQFIGHLEPLSIAECVIYHKPKERLQLLASCRSLFPWLGLTDSLARAGYAFAVSEFLYRHTHEEPDDAIFDLARETLEAMASLPESYLGRQFWGFTIALLDRLGFRPELTGCVRCGRRPEIGKRVMFDAVAGKIVCRDCRREQNDAGRWHILSSEALTELQNRQSLPILGGNEPPLSSKSLDAIAVSLEDFARYHLGGNKLRSLELAQRAEA